ncbi:glycosyltransferase [Fulvivirga lutimaris]|uniref:glycosyltransferase n=1 Tax=Fulvivirga lutimaris TaxID=1819566 RepID=UPI001625D75F|nr:glycosyltransferase [Fulvivirga lutimaris]
MSKLYFERYAYRDAFIEEPPSPNLGLVVTIPCFNEPDLISSLVSLKACEPPGCDVEVIVVINESQNASESIKKQNSDTLNAATAWSAAHSSNQLKFFIHYEALPPKHAGVGLARKIAMDEAARRLDHVGNINGIISCYDADSLCEQNYLTALEAYFKSNPKSPGCSIHFEHPLQGPENEKIYQAIVDYELFLRYYVHALKYAQYPHAHQTIGSSMAVRNNIYQKQGGMNKRKAGEDFYFLQKIIPLGQFGDLNKTKVIPSPRISDRVPFGTGKAVNEWLSNGKLNTYNYLIFSDLLLLIKSINSSKDFKNIISELANTQWPDSIKSFLETLDFENNIERIANNSGSLDAFKSNFYQWFDAFKVLKYVHYARDHFHPNIPIYEAASGLLKMNGITPGPTAKEVLVQYREIDKSS